MPRKLLQELPFGSPARASETGTYNYFFSEHPKLTGKVTNKSVVEPLIT
jgi:hypothetical protein